MFDLSDQMSFKMMSKIMQKSDPTHDFFHFRETSILNDPPMNLAYNLDCSGTKCHPELLQNLAYKTLAKWNTFFIDKIEKNADFGVHLGPPNPQKNDAGTFGVVSGLSWATLGGQNVPQSDKIARQNGPLDHPGRPQRPKVAPECESSPKNTLQSNQTYEKHKTFFFA